MIPKKILNVVDLREHIAFILNNQLDVNISGDNIYLELEEMKCGAVPYIYEYHIGIELGNRLPVKPMTVIIDPANITILYVKKSTKNGYEFNEGMTIISYVDATMFSI